MKTLALRLAAVAALLVSGLAHAQVPQLINYQGRVAVGTVNFDGSGAFKFALVNGDGTLTYWSNDGTSTAGSEPAAAVTLTVTKGLYSVLLGDATQPQPHMAVMPATVFTNPDVRLRVWFNDGSHGSQLLTPDQRVAAVGYAMMAGNAATVADGAITAAKLAPGALSAPQIVAGTSQLAQANQSYVATSGSQTSFTLPTSGANVGDVVQITGAGAGGWTVTNPVAADDFPDAFTPHAVGTYGLLFSMASSGDGSFLVAAGYSELFTSTNFGADWHAQFGGLPLRDWRAVAVSRDPDVNGKYHLIVAEFGGSLWTSADSGVTWTEHLASQPHSWIGVASSADGSHLVAADPGPYDNNIGTSTGGQLWVSTNSGVTWTVQTAAGTHAWNSVTISADGSKIAAADYGIYDPGTFTQPGNIYTWSAADPVWRARDANSSSWSSVASSTDGGKLIAGGYSVDKFDNFGATRSNLLGANSDSAAWIVATSADGTRFAATAQDYNSSPTVRIFTSANFGQDWTQHESGRRWRSLVFSVDGTHLAALDEAGTVYTASLTTTLSGAQGSTVAMQYFGSGQWAPVKQTSIAAGVVGTTQLASNSVQTSKIASGAVGSAQLGSNLNLNGTTAGTFSGDGAGLTNLNAASLTGAVQAANISVPLSLSGAVNTDPNGPGIFSATNTGTGTGIFGLSISGNGIYGQAGTGGNGVYGNNPTGTGVAATSDSGWAIYAASNTGYGIYAQSNTTDAGHFVGDVSITGKTTTLGGLIIEVRAADPLNPVTGRIWLINP